MKQGLGIFLFFLLLSPIGIYAQQTLNGAISHGGLTRTYVLYIPSNYSGEESVPLVYNFHGYTSNANDQMFYGNFQPIADTAGFLIVHPMGTLDSEGKTHFNVGWGGSSVDDVGFARALLDTLSNRYNIDQDRVYSTGMSNGGYISYYLACQMSDRIAAIASVTGSMTPLQFITCDPQHPMPILQIHGTQDNVVPYAGANWTKGIEEVMSYWVNYNNCDQSPKVSELEDISTSDGSQVEEYLYENGDKGVVTKLLKVLGGGHTWPGNVFNNSGVNKDINGSLEVWRFFCKYDLNGLRNVTSIDDLDTGGMGFRIFPNPTPSHIRVESPLHRTGSYELLNLAGQVLNSGSFSQAEFELNLEPFPPGIYLLKSGTSSYKILKTD